MAAHCDIIWGGTGIHSAYSLGQSVISLKFDELSLTGVLSLNITWKSGRIFMWKNTALQLQRPDEKWFWRKGLGLFSSLPEPKTCADLAPWNSPPVWAALPHLQGYLYSDPIISLQLKVTFSNFSKLFSKPSDFWTLTNVDLFCKNHLKCPLFLEALHDFLTFPSICSGIVRKYL